MTPPTAVSQTAASQITAVALQRLSDHAQTLGFDRLGVINVDPDHAALEQAGQYLENWVAQGLHGSMEYMRAHGSKRWRPAELLPGTTRIIALRLHYLPSDQEQAIQVLTDKSKAYISRYALGRDYHKTFRQKLQKLSRWMQEVLLPDYAEHLAESVYQPRVFVDSAPVMEKAIAQAAGLGWIGKNTLVLDRQAGSWFFLGEIYTNFPFPSIAPSVLEKEAANHCGRCSRCIDVCPTQAIIAPYVLDARRCISYLTIENKGPIPLEFRSAIGNRIFGCDDCQLYCPWNRFTKLNQEIDFQPRHALDQLTIVDGLLWLPEDFDRNTQGSPIRRTGYYGWLRNLAVAAGNHAPDQVILTTLQRVKARLVEVLSANAAPEPTDHNVNDDLKVTDRHSIEMVIEHIDWAIEQQQTNLTA